MSAATAEPQDRLDEILSMRATERLSHEDEQEMRLLLDEYPATDEFGFDRAAAALDLALTGHGYSPMPDSVRDRVETAAVAFAARSRGLRVSDDAEDRDQTTVSRGSRASRMGWLAAAACLALAALAWLPLDDWSGNARTMYDRLSGAAGVTKASWIAPGGEEITGDILWDQESQRGVMRLRGLAPNNPDQLQYQLWIFDEGRASAEADSAGYNAVDGGVFDVPSDGGDVYIKVDSKLRVFDPSLFAVTTEPPGGVVKHVTRGDYRIVLTAAPTKSS